MGFAAGMGALSPIPKGWLCLQLGPEAAGGPGNPSGFFPCRCTQWSVLSSRELAMGLM